MVAASEGLKPSADPLDGVWNAGTAGEEAEEPLSGTKVAASWSNFSSLKSLIALIAPLPWTSNPSIPVARSGGEMSELHST